MIPKTIWQTWKTHELPPIARRCRQSWINLNPDHAVHLHDDEQCRELARDFGGDVLAAYDRLPLGVMKADFWRYLTLYRHGGLYADLDTTCRTPVQNWMPDDASFVVGPERLGLCCFCQWAFGATPKHAILEHVIELVCGRCDTPPSPHFVHHVTGPAAFTAAFDAYLAATGLPARASGTIQAVRVCSRLPQSSRRAGSAFFRTGTSTRTPFSTISAVTSGRLNPATHHGSPP